ncbi:MAG: hypothetical protein AVDCRST_MAG70-429, partial [uncultured Thermomicrobiales bacterium]
CLVPLTRPRPGSSPWLGWSISSSPSSGSNRAGRIGRLCWEARAHR